MAYAGMGIVEQRVFSTSFSVRDAIMENKSGLSLRKQFTEMIKQKCVGYRDSLRASIPQIAFEMKTIE